MTWQSDWLALTVRLRKARKAARMTQEQAGAVIGVCGRTYREFESGKGDLSSMNLFKLAAALRVPIDKPAAEKRKDFSAFAEGVSHHGSH